MGFRPQELRHPTRLAFAMALTQLPRACHPHRDTHMNMFPAPKCPVNMAIPQRRIHWPGPWLHGGQAAAPVDLSAEPFRARMGDIGQIFSSS